MKDTNRLSNLLLLALQNLFSRLASYLPAIHLHPSQLPEPPREKTRDGWIPAVASTVDTGGTSKIDSAGDELFFQGIETQWATLYLRVSICTGVIFTGIIFVIAGYQILILWTYNRLNQDEERLQEAAIGLA